MKLIGSAVPMITIQSAVGLSSCPFSLSPDLVLISGSLPSSADGFGSSLLSAFAAVPSLPGAVGVASSGSSDSPVTWTEISRPAGGVEAAAASAARLTQIACSIYLTMTVCLRRHHGSSRAPLKVREYAKPQWLHPAIKSWRLMAAEPSERCEATCKHLRHTMPS